MRKLLVIGVLILLVQGASAQWGSMGNPGGVVRALCIHNNELYAGGDFPGLVKKWNGSSWVAAGSLSGTTGPKVNCLISYNGTLYAGGSFIIAGSTLGNVAKLVGNTWTASEANGLGGTTQGTEVKCFYNWSNVLYAGGTFNMSGGNFLQKVAKLVNGNWQQVGGGAPTSCSSGVYAICDYYGYLYVAGQGSAPWINKLDIGGAQWLDLPAGGPQQGTGIYALNVLKHYPNATALTLFIGGDFTNLPSNTVCKIYSSSWGTANTFASGGKVNCFVSSSNGALGAQALGTIYAGGLFSAGANPTNNIAKRTSASVSEWDTAGTPAFNNAIRALCFFDGYLVAGGDFTSPGSNVARYATTVDVKEISDNIIVNNIYPNPIIKDAILSLKTKSALLQPELRILDVNGNEIANHAARGLFNHAQNEVEFKIDREGLAAGIYYYTVLDEEQTVATGKLIVE